MSVLPECTLSGAFFRAIPTDRLEAVLDPPNEGRAGRYHRHGQAALYLSPLSEWARIAVSGYMREDGHPRLVVPLALGEARLLDQRDAEGCLAHGLMVDRSNHPWRSALAAGAEPPSWEVSDAARAAGFDGLVDVSRNIPGGWHVVLFRWNAPGAPGVEVAGDPVRVWPKSSGPKWS